MPLLGKIVVIKRNGGDGTEFPLTASCLFGRKLDCDIRIQLPQVSKEHCKIELNENKELILTNLSSVNPTRINGQVFSQSERLKHGDLITIIDRSFRFEYPPPKTPKKRLSTPGKVKAVWALQEQQEKGTPVPVEKRKSEHSFDTCLKDGSNLPPSVEQTVETEPEDCKLKKDSLSPFCELYQMVKHDLVAKSPWKSEQPKTPLAKPQIGHEKVSAADVKSSQKWVPTPSAKKRRSSKSNSEDTTGPAIPQSSFNANVEENPTDDVPSIGSTTPSMTEKCVTPVSQKNRTPLKTPQKFSAGEVVQQILLQPQPEEKTPKSPKGRRSGGSQDQSLVHQMPSVQPQTPGPNDNTEGKMSPRTSPRANAGKRFQIQDVLPDITATTSSSKKEDDTSVNELFDRNESRNEVTVPKAKKKRVSFGGQLSPELFDKCLPPNSPLRRGATPRHSLGPSQRPQSLLRRASTIGLLALRLRETISEAQKCSPNKASPKRSPGTKAKTPSPAKRSPGTKVKTPSPAKRSPGTKVKTPSPAKRSPGTKAKTPSPAKRSPGTKAKSPKPQKSPTASTKAPTPSSTPATPSTPASAKRASTSAIEAVGDMSLTETPKVQGRFSVSLINTPSPVQDQGNMSEPQSAIAEDVPQKCVTPKIPLRRKSMKSSARKTPKSAIKSALNVIRSRRSGASRANLKVLTSWADIVKFGQIKPQTEVTTKKKPMKSSIVKRTVMPKPKTPAQRLKDDVSTGHAASPVTIVVGKAHMRTNPSVGAAPKIVPNIALFKKDMKMDEDLTGVAEIFKTPANTRSKNRVPLNKECPEIPLDEVSVMKTPEESGEMLVSPLSVVSTAKSGRYNNEAVTRLLLDNQDGSLLEDEGLSQLPDNSIETSCHDIIPDVETPSNIQTEEEEAAPETVLKTPKQNAAPSLCLTGVKRLMKTPKQKAEPIEDLRGKLIKTPKECKPTQGESLEGIKELLKTPKYRGAPVEDMVGVKRVMQTPKEKSNPVLCASGLQRLMRTPKEKAEHHEDLTGVKELMKTPEIKGDMVENPLRLKRLAKTPKQKRNQVEEDLTGVQQLMKTPKHKGEPVEDQMGIQRLMQTPKETVKAVEDFSALNQLMQTPKLKGEPVSSQFELSELMKTPQLEAMTEESTGLKELEPENSSFLTTESSVTEPAEIQELVESGSAFMPAEGLDEECDQENVCQVETMETEVLKSMDLQCTAKAVESNQSHPEIETVIPKERHPDQIEEEIVSVDATDVCSSVPDKKTQEQSEETVCVSDNTNATVEATPTSSTAEQEELVKSPPASKIQRGTRGRAAQKSKNGNNEMAKAPAVLSLIEEENMSSQLPASPTRGRRGKKLLEVPEITASPVRKSARGRVPKHSFVEEEATDTEAEMPGCLPVVTKTRKGRKAKQDGADAAVAPTHDANAVDPQCPDANAVDPQCPDANAVDPQCPDANEKQVQAPLVKPGRRKKMDKPERQPSEELEQKTTEIVCEENAIAPEDVKLQTSLCAETISASRARRGRPAKKEHLKTEPTAALESEITSTHAVVVAEKPVIPVAKSVRGRRDKKETVKDQPLDDDDVMVVSKTVAEANADHKEEPETPVVKSGRGRKTKQQKPQMAEEVVDQPAVDTSTHLPVTEEHTETVVKSVRGNRKTKQSKETVSVEAEKTVVSPVEQAETPVVKSGRKRAVNAKETEMVADVSVKRGRRAVADPAPPVAVVSSRARKAVVKAESEVTEDVASSKEPVKPVKHTRRTAKAPESKKEENTMTQAGSEFVAAEKTPGVALEKVERGNRGKKLKDSTKDIPNNPINESATADEASEIKPSKTVNWNQDLVVCKDIEKSGTSTDVKEPQMKKSKRLGKLPAEMPSTESNQSTDLPPRGRRGRGVKNEEIPVEETQEEAQIKVKPLRRGKAVAPSDPKSEPTDSKISTPLKRKRIEVMDESVNKEPLPKRRGRVAEVAAEVSSKEKTPEAEPEKAEPTPKKTGKKATRGQKSTAQEPDPAPAKAQESVSGTTTRKARSVKKLEEVDVPAEAAPVRRTRRK
ncbi:proliferation marker protein Ki-67-like isoform X2 [Cyprinus carpio]|uniref:Proliferation marker protein Ki-67-like isoform X2 n=1 Tax=Cyprinus carpio TaxID=7962 RepID=A0A9R0B7J6_CYPCA|nr:proliferation marker protein Ki-67-like isoform X2 [Cyprinus carpio]